jgi:hypothetical protein
MLCAILNVKTDKPGYKTSYCYDPNIGQMTKNPCGINTLQPKTNNLYEEAGINRN